MKIINKIDELRSVVSRFQGDTGFVPTMGYLHEGHADLIRESVARNPNTVVSIFVNAAQFGEGEDLDRYPRDTGRDIKLLESLKADVLFMPDTTEVYPEGYKTYVSVKEMGDVLCGSSRPGHFTGVATVVLKLVNIVEPRYLYLGEKDAQQLIILKKVFRDLNVRTEIRSVETRRSEDGLALSSRNSYLTDQGREKALSISRSLRLARQMITDGGNLDSSIIREAMTKEIRDAGDIIIDYIETVSLKTLERVDKIDLKGTLIAVAAFVEGVRLIDNIIFGEI